MDRRTFLKLAGMGSLAFASACTLENEKNLYSLVRLEDDMTPGRASWYASTCRQCPAGCGVLAKNREGRVIKLEGNPLHPVNSGKLCIRGQAALQEIYHPDRLKKPRIRENNTWKTIGYDRALALLAEKTKAAAAKGENRVRMVTQIEGGMRMDVFKKALAAANSTEPLVFEPFSFEKIRAANQQVFGVNAIGSWKIREADLLVGFGADFCETWLSPVEYARQFKTMHAWQGTAKGRFFHVSPWRGITGANADAWLSCAPGTEAAICLGLIRRVMEQNPPGDIPARTAKAIRAVSDPFDDNQVTAMSGINPDAWQRLAAAISEAESPLVLGGPTTAADASDVQTEFAVNLLNYLLDPGLEKMDFTRPHRVQKAASHLQIFDFFDHIGVQVPDVVLLNQVNPVYALGPEIKQRLEQTDAFVVSFSNFMDETAQCADLVFPTSLALESWDEYGAYPDLLSLCQPAMKPLYGGPCITDVFLQIAPDAAQNTANAKEALLSHVQQNYPVSDTRTWMQAVRKGGLFDLPRSKQAHEKPRLQEPGFAKWLTRISVSGNERDLSFAALPSVRFFDGRAADLPWACEIPDPVIQVAWQSPVLVHPHTAAKLGLSHEDVVSVRTVHGQIQAPVYETADIHPGVMGLQAGQGHTAGGRYAKGQGANAFSLFSVKSGFAADIAVCQTGALEVEKTGQKQKLAATAGSMDPHGRKIALTASADELAKPAKEKKQGLAMHDFPLTLPLPEGYDKHRDFYPPHDHKDYRWAMVVDLDRCIGCSACAAACYAENNLAVAGEEQIINGREMSWIHIERYWQIDDPENFVFLPMLCQHCDNAPCESVCPVYAPHHSKEGLNNQIYNRCIGTRFCAQNCPYKVRRFNWFDWKWPAPLNLQLNPDVTVRSKGVMEKCSFCVQRIKAAHGRAKDENRKIRDGEVTPACVQTCPTDALVFGSLMDERSRVSQMVRDRRAYQVMGYLNTKPAVIYLKKVVHKI